MTDYPISEWWTQSDGGHVLLRTMEIGHLRNALRWAHRQGWWLGPVGDDEPGDALDGWDQHERYRSLVDEWHRRGLARDAWRWTVGWQARQNRAWDPVTRTYGEPRPWPGHAGWVPRPAKPGPYLARAIATIRATSEARVTVTPDGTGRHVGRAYMRTVRTVDFEGGVPVAYRGLVGCMWGRARRVIVTERRTSPPGY